MADNEEIKNFRPAPVQDLFLCMSKAAQKIAAIEPNEEDLSLKVGGDAKVPIKVTYPDGVAELTIFDMGVHSAIVSLYHAGNQIITIAMICRTLCMSLRVRCHSENLQSAVRAAIDKMRSIYIYIDAQSQQKQYVLPQRKFYDFMRNLPQDKIGWSIRVLLMTGLRKQELCALEPRYIAGDGSSITVVQAVTRSKGSTFISDTKTLSSRRVVPVPEGARKYLIQLRNSCSSGLIWESDRRPGQPINPKTFDDFYYAALESVGAQRLSPHCCRHTYVSLAQSVSIPMEVIRALVGHSDTYMTEHYLHVLENAKITEVNKLNVFCE